MDPRFSTFNDILNLVDLDFVSTQKINTIKLVRQITGEGLKEAKNFVEGPLLSALKTDEKKVLETSRYDEITDRLRNLEIQMSRFQDSENRRTTKLMVGSVFEDGD